MIARKFGGMLNTLTSCKKAWVDCATLDIKDKFLLWLDKLYYVATFNETFFAFNKYFDD